MTLYLVATPIGNLADMTFRAVEILRSCDYILCEDTRHSRPLLQHYSIEKPLRSYHKFNEAAREESVLQDLLANQNIALISDAGTPGISDPGARLVQAAVTARIDVVPIPGACAAVTGLCASGLPTDRFQFVGFLPKRDQELRLLMVDVLAYTGTTICYEAPTRLLDLLTLLMELCPSRHLVVGRELTKKFEEFCRGTATELLTRWQDQKVKGEIVVMIAPASDQEVSWHHLTAEEHVLQVEKQFNISRKEAIKVVADLRAISKRDLYRDIHSST